MQAAAGLSWTDRVPPLIGTISDRVGIRTAMLVLPAAGVLGGLVTLGALRTVGRDMARVRA